MFEPAPRKVTADSGAEGERLTALALVVDVGPVQEPVHEAVALVDTGRTGHLDPVLGDDALAVPLTFAQKQVAEARHVAGVDVHAPAPVTASADRLHVLAVDHDPGVLVSVPAPGVGGADGVHDVLAQHLRQRPAPHVGRHERQEVHADVVVLVVRARGIHRPVRVVGGGLADGAVRPVGLAPERAFPVARLPQQMIPV